MLAALELYCAVSSPRNRTTIGQSALARLRHPIGGRGLLPSELQDLTLMRQVWATKRQLWLSPEVPLGNTGVGRHSSRHQPAFPSPDAQRKTEYILYMVRSSGRLGELLFAEAAQGETFVMVVHPQNSRKDAVG